MAKKEFNLADLLEGMVSGIDEAKNTMDDYVPHPQQEVFHSSDLPERLFIGGNRSGKTVASVLECLWRLTKTHPFNQRVNEIRGPIRGRLVAVSFKDGVDKIILPLFKQWIHPRYLINRSWSDSFDNYAKVLTLKDGSYIEFMSYDQELEKFAGTSRHFIAFDEEPEMAIWQECKLRLLDTEGSWWIAMTPVEGMTWLYDEIYLKWENGDRPFTLVIEVNTNDNPHLSERGKQIAFGDLSEEDRNTREGGKFNANAGKIYKEFNERVHVCNNGIPHKGVGAQIYTSLDTGFRHPAAWLWHAVFPNGRVITFHEISESEHPIEQLARKVNDFEQTILFKLGYTSRDIIRTGDPAMLQTRENTGVSVIAEYAKYGLYIGVRGVTRDVDTGIGRVSEYLDPNNSVQDVVSGVVVTVPMWQITKSCDKLIVGMRNYRWDKHNSRKAEYEKAPKKVPFKKRDDEVDSARYFFTLMPELMSARIIKKPKADMAQIAHDAGLRVMPTDSPFAQPFIEGSHDYYDMEM